MLISNFFTETLGANLRNQRWSWGATDGTTNRVFLRVWEDEIEEHDGIEYVLVDWHEYRNGYSSLGIQERRDRLDQIGAGAQGFGVVCKPLVNGARRKIASFDSEHLLRFGELEEWESYTVARIVERVPVAHLKSARSSETTLLDDLRRISRRKAERTEKESLARARIGQGQFRADILKIWSNACAITGCTITEAIRASHIKPWAYSNDEERLDPENGIPLLANFDALFDAGLITFETDGRIQVSERVPVHEAQRLGLVNLKLRCKPSKRMKQYLDYHRLNVYLPK